MAFLLAIFLPDLSFWLSFYGCVASSALFTLLCFDQGL
jgi:hypothetical protein